MDTLNRRDLDAGIAALVEVRHNPTEPSPQAVAADAERRRRDRRRADERQRNRVAWAAYHERLAENLDALAEHHRQQAQLLEGGR